MQCSKQDILIFKEILEKTPLGYGINSMNVYMI